MMQPTVVSLFCGAGGMDLGFIQAGFQVIWGIDNNKDSCLSHRTWSEIDIINEDIHNIDMEMIPESDVVIGSLLQTGFSLAKSKSIANRQKNLDIVIDIIGCKKPKAFLLEGHKSFKNLETGLLYDYLDQLNNIGYDISYQVLNTKDYSIAQHKERLILIGLKKGLNLEFHFPIVHSNLKTVREVIGNLGGINDEDRKYISESRLEISGISRWNGIKFLDLDGLSPSINSMSKLIRKDLYQQGGKQSTIAWQEAAAIQSFPKEIYFHGSLDSKFKQIANSFPPQLAYYLACELMFIFKNDNDIFNENAIFNTEKPINLESDFEIYKEIPSPNYIQDDNENNAVSVMVENIEVIYSELTETEILINQIKSLPTGGGTANEYHEIIFRCLKYIFADSFKRGRSEVLINNGRKRVDIVFDNFSTTGFFAHIRDSHQVFCPRIIIECKNHTYDIANPEVDQLLGRLGDRTGRLGILICREILDKQKLMNRCKDALNQLGSYILFLTDIDIIKLIKLKEGSDEEAFLEYLSSLWDRLTLNN